MRRLLPLVLLLAACAEPRPNLTDHLVECGFLTPGERVHLALRDVYLPSDCYEDCFARASCEAILATLCRTSFDLAFACDQECALRCGDGTLIGPERECDGAQNCTDGSDERGCTNTVVCSNGSTAVGARCDGRYDCGDGSDEQACPGLTCGDYTLPPSDRCDGIPRCFDGSDERDCPTYRCANGRMFQDTSNARCNGYIECEDGSDEAGCARFTLTCSP